MRSEEDVRKLLTYIRANGIKFDDVIIAGHGTKDLIALGGVDRRVKDDGAIVDNDYLDFSDFDDPSLDVSSIMKDDGQLILFSCSNGAGADKEDNMANRYASTLRPGQRVVSSQVPTNIDYMDRDDEGRIQIYWVGAKPYIVRGKKS